MVDYKSSGVDLDAAQAFVEAIKPLVKRTFRPEVMAEIGGFGALFSLDPDHYRRPVLVSATDGVGTKLKVAFMAGRHDTVGIDLVAMCVNDIVVQGAEPLFFLDYLAMGKLDATTAQQIVEGVARGCLEAGCALIGGETAEMPGLYRAGEYDLAGFCVGVVESDRLIDGSAISVGDALIGIASNGLHANGYSLVRKIFFRRLRWKLDRYVPELGRTLGEELLAPTRIYARTVLNLVRDFRIKGLAHITGGGIMENLARILPEGCQALIKKASWQPPPIFTLIRERGKVDEEEMYRVFNNGLGLILVCHPEAAEDILQRLSALNEKAFLIGEIVRRPSGQPPVRCT
jgi:phosphoribosylformylglycinamidine cyclo-ligase